MIGDRICLVRAHSVLELTDRIRQETGDPRVHELVDRLEHLLGMTGDEVRRIKQAI